MEQGRSRFERSADSEAYKRMGAHPLVRDGEPGVRFAVRAPAASAVSVVGPFNNWSFERNPMQNRDGLWELFIPGLEIGTVYKYDIRRKNGFRALKADPYAFFSELRPQTGSRVWGLGRYEWSDAEWMARRRRGPDPLCIYELHLSSWRLHSQDGDWLSYRSLADELLPYLKELGFSHLELMPIAEHPLDDSWGYQVAGFFAPTSRFGNPDDFRFFVDRCHQAGIGVILDWVGGHFPRDRHGLEFFDGTRLYEYEDPRMERHPDWKTLVFDYTHPEVARFLLSNAVFWLEEYHVDGLRFDAVSSMIYRDYSRKDGHWLRNKDGGRENYEAIALLKRINETLHARFPGAFTVAEESSFRSGVTVAPEEGGLGFDFKWDLGWMHDILDYFGTEPAERADARELLELAARNVFRERHILPLSHDEVVHGKGSLFERMPGCEREKIAQLRLLYAYMYAHPGAKLLFMGAELGQPCEWDFKRQLNWELQGVAGHSELGRYLAVLNDLYRSESLFREGECSGEGFEWLEAPQDGLLLFARHGAADAELALCLFNPGRSGVQTCRLTPPAPGEYRVVLNSDDSLFKGSGSGPRRGSCLSPDGSGKLVFELAPLSAIILLRHCSGE